MPVPNYPDGCSRVTSCINRGWAFVATGVLLAVALGVVVAVPNLWPFAGGAIALSALLVGVVARPRWAVIALVAFPPGLLALITSGAGVSNPLMYAVITASIVAFWFGPRRAGNLGLVIGYGGLLLLMSISVLRHQVPEAIGTAGALTTFFYYGAMYSLVLNSSPADKNEGRRYAEALQVAILVSVLASGAIAVFQLGPEFFSTFNVKLFPEETGLLYSRTHFGYFVALGFAVAFPRWILTVEQRVLWTVLLVLSAALVVMSMTRGAWLGALLLVIIVAIVTQRWILLGAVPLTGLFGLIPGIRARLTSDLAGGALLAVQSGAAGSHRVLLWAVLFAVALREPFLGHGFGFVSSLYPSIFFGENQFVTKANALVYAHNDLLYLMLELGLVGVALYVAAAASVWTSLLRAVALARRHLNSSWAPVVFSCLGVAIVTLISQAADNGFFIRAVYERFAVIAATLWIVLDAVAETGDEAGSVEL